MKLNTQLNRIMSTAAAKQQWTRLGAEAQLLSPDEVSQRFRDEVAKLSKLAQDSGAKLD